MTVCEPLIRSKEHLLLPDVFLPDPALLVDIYCDSELLDTFGFYQASLDEVERGIFFRAVLLTGCHLLETEELTKCRAVLKNGQEAVEFGFNAAKNQFVPDDCQKT